MSRQADPAGEAEGDGERLQKVLARAGIGSRRTCDELIAAGRVLVNGRPARLGQRVDVASDVVLLDGAPVGILPGLVYYLLNKPEGVITTASDPEGRPTVMDLVPCLAAGLFRRPPRCRDERSLDHDQRRGARTDRRPPEQRRREGVPRRARRRSLAERASTTARGRRDRARRGHQARQGRKACSGPACGS